MAQVAKCRAGRSEEDRGEEQSEWVRADAVLVVWLVLRLLAQLEPEELALIAPRLGVLALFAGKRRPARSMQRGPPCTH